MNKFTVLRSGQEQKNYWTFRLSEHCTGTIVCPLKTGDYTLQGFEDILCIERKGCIAEFAHNLFEERFYRELDRMLLFTHSYILLEFTMDDLLNYPHSAKLPKSVRYKIKVTGPYLLKKLIEVLIKYPNIHILFCGDNGQKVALQILKEIYQLEKT